MKVITESLVLSKAKTEQVVSSLVIEEDRILFSASVHIGPYSLLGVSSTNITCASFILGSKAFMAGSGYIFCDTANLESESVVQTGRLDELTCDSCWKGWIPKTANSLYGDFTFVAQRVTATYSIFIFKRLIISNEMPKRRFVGLPEDRLVFEATLRATACKIIFVDFVMNGTSSSSTLILWNALELVTPFVFPNPDDLIPRAGMETCNCTACEESLCRDLKIGENPGETGINVGTSCLTVIPGGLGILIGQSCGSSSSGQPVWFYGVVVGVPCAVLLVICLALGLSCYLKRDIEARTEKLKQDILTSDIDSITTM